MEKCIFCRIIKGELPSKQIYRDDKVIAFKDINPKAPIHILVVPIKHIESMIETQDMDKSLLGGIMLRAKTIAAQQGLDKTGYKIVINNGSGSGQLVFHLHLHLLGGWKKELNWQV